LREYGSTPCATGLPLASLKAKYANSPSAIDFNALEEGWETKYQVNDEFSGIPSSIIKKKLWQLAQNAIEKKKLMQRGILRLWLLIMGIY
jgi:hypothetical protein